ncbi:MAG: hypothetical protein WBZ39_02730 [Methylovirgula sp.]
MTNEIGFACSIIEIDARPTSSALWDSQLGALPLAPCFMLGSRTGFLFLQRSMLWRRFHDLIDGQLETFPSVPLKLNLHLWTTCGQVVRK